MDAPTVEDVKGWSRLDFGALDEPYSDDDLAVLLARAMDYVWSVTGQTLATVPVPLVTMAQEAIQMRCEQVAIQSGTDYTEEAADDLVQTFGAGAYNQSRRNLAQEGPQRGLPLLNPHPGLNQRLWLLATDDMRDYWWSLFAGTMPPGMEVTEVDWGNYDGAFPYASGDWPQVPDPFTWGA
jgi:hypothetical protein